ncbi:hypothetical protein A3C96_02555 [Candidatus Uhrbacteria bacterium RIFCSPHIGHO2_02_FULL_60_10]|uniref:Lipoprotein n=1 Tax=Candidatus Uhrbacteria bacterium RIFCSPHIGHO2_02_FULL_60_10 TaxID=1802392 RepID=A0A1F7U3Z7_9BACT|nr:MAG: hypothetical protein A3C96_02555 [Candidatus Uhrbacteria bacterium RIFCSPHIGHO2_02_FULL_60_10]
MKTIVAVVAIFAFAGCSHIALDKDGQMEYNGPATPDQAVKQYRAQTSREVAIKMVDRGMEPHPAAYINLDSQNERPQPNGPGHRPYNYSQPGADYWTSMYGYSTGMYHPVYGSGYGAGQWQPQQAPMASDDEVRKLRQEAAEAKAKAEAADRKVDKLKPVIKELIDR